MQLSAVPAGLGQTSPHLAPVPSTTLVSQQCCTVTDCAFSMYTRPCTSTRNNMEVHVIGTGKHQPCMARKVFVPKQVLMLHMHIGHSASRSTGTTQRACVFAGFKGNVPAMGRNAPTPEARGRETMCMACLPSCLPKTKPPLLTVPLCTNTRCLCSTRPGLRTSRAHCVVALELSTNGMAP